MSLVYVRRLRLGAAFVLLAYLILHFANHALGLVSLGAMETGRWWFLALWRSAAGTLALYVYTRYKDLSFWRWVDIVAPAVFLMQAIARWGNFFNQ